MDISVDNELNLSRISVPENDNLIDDLVNENPNLSGLIDLDVFNTSIISANDLKGDLKSDKGKITKGQMVKNKSKKDNFNVESDLNGDLKSDKGKVTKGQVAKNKIKKVNFNVESDKAKVKMVRVTRNRTPKK